MSTKNQYQTHQASEEKEKCDLYTKKRHQTNLTPHFFALPFPNNEPIRLNFAARGEIRAISVSNRIVGDTGLDSETSWPFMKLYLHHKPLRSATRKKRKRKSVSWKRRAPGMVVVFSAINKVRTRFRANLLVVSFIPASINSMYVIGSAILSKPG